VVSPTTLPAAFVPSSLAALMPSGTTPAAIFVMLIELVLVANIAFGCNSCAKLRNMACFNEKFSDTAYRPKSQIYIKE
jgi:hypothetical protein